MTVEELALPAAAPAVDREGPGLAMHAVPGQPGKARLAVDMVLPIELAARIVALIGEEIGERESRAD
jgi:hypothetical protein